MRLTDRLLAFTLVGSEWVLWLLVGLSVLSVAIMVERGVAVGSSLPNFDELSKKLLALLTSKDIGAARKVIADSRAPEARVGLVGLDELARGRNATLEAMASAKARERMALERRLGILGTLGNNAPFIGLFGTVLGIIKAFADLARNQGQGGAAVVMAGISEALVATAVGLLVAIPAVIAFNILQGRVRRAMGRIDSMAHLILSAIPEGNEATSAEVPRAKADHKSGS